MFSHLFLYGLGGIGSTNSKFVKMSEIMCKKQPFIYHDKWFQCDLYFSFVAFNYEPMKRCITGGYLLI